MLQVTDISVSSTYYPSNSANCGGVTVPATYYSNGFDQTQMDLVNFIHMENNSAVSFVAQAGACTHIRWPTYGHTNFNAYYVGTDLTKWG